jgi:hypothetical protein
MYYSDKDNPYAPRTGPAAMPSPRSKHAPYFSGRRDTFEEFLAEFEDLAHDCRLTNPERVDTIIHYVNPSTRELCKTLHGYYSRDWTSFRHSLLDAFGRFIPRHEIDRQKLHDFIKDSSRTRMACEEDVLQYHKAFIHYTVPLIHSRHLTESERDVEFWYGFHPRDRDLLWPRLLHLCPFQPRNVPFRSEDVLYFAHRAFAYEEHRQFSSRESHFEPRSVDRRYPSYSQSYSQPSSDPRFPSPHSFTDHRHSSDPHFPSSFSPSPSDFRHMPTPSATAMEAKPESEPEYTRSITPTSPHAPLFSASCMDIVPEPEHTLSSSLPPTPLVLPSTQSLASSCTKNVPEPERASKSLFPPPGLVPSIPLPTHSPVDTASTPLPQPSITPTPFLSSIPTDLKLSPTRPTKDDEPETETKKEIQTETEPEPETETETEKENEYTLPLSLTVPPPPPSSSIPPESEYPEQPEHELVSQAVPVESPLVARRQYLVCEDPELKSTLSLTNIAQPRPSACPPESPSEPRKPFPAPLEISNAPDPPHSTSQVRTLAVASLDPDSSLLTSSVLSTPVPSAESAEPESLCLPARSIPLMLRSLLTLSHSPPSTIDVPEIVSTPPGLPPPVPSTSSDSSSIPARPPSLPRPQLSELFRNPKPEPEPSRFSCSIPPMSLVPLRAPSSTDFPGSLCTSFTPRLESLSESLPLVDTAPLIPSKLPSASCKSIPPALFEVSSAADRLRPHSPLPERTLGVTTVDSVSVPLEDTSVPASSPLIPHQGLPDLEVTSAEASSTLAPSTANLLPTSSALLSARSDHSIASPSSPSLSGPVCQLSKSSEPEFPLASSSLQKSSVLPAKPPTSVHSPSPSPPRRQLAVTQLNSVSTPLEDTSAASPANPSTLERQVFEVTLGNSVSSTFEITPVPSPAVPPSQLLNAPRLPHPIPQLLEWQGPAPGYEVPSTLTSRVPHSSSPLPLPSVLSSIRFNFAFSLVTAAALISALLNISATLPTLVQQRWSRNEDFGSTQYIDPSYSFNFTHWFRPAQQTVRPARLVFDPGGYTFALASLEVSKMFDDPSRRHTVPPLASSPCTPRWPAVIPLINKNFLPFNAETVNFFSLGA